MRIIRISIISVAFCLAAPLWAGAQTAQNTPDPLDLLKNVAETYKAMMTFHADQVSVVEMNMPSMQQKMEMPGTLAFDSKGRVRMESKGATAMLMIFDGQTFWTYMPQLNKYMKISDPGMAAASAGGAGMQSFGMGGLGGFGADFTTLGNRVHKANVLRSEDLPADGSRISCWVVSIEYETSQSNADSEGNTGTTSGFNSRTATVWIEKEHFLVYKQTAEIVMTMPGQNSKTSSKTTITFSHIIVDEPLPEDTFTFIPPPGATEMDLSSFMPKSPSQAEPPK